jgi:serine protease Do
VEDAGSLRFRLATLDVGSTATLSVPRKRQALEIPVRLIAPPETPPAQKTELTGAQPWPERRSPISPALAEQLQLLGEWKGVVIIQIRAGPRPCASA